MADQPEGLGLSGSKIDATGSSAASNGNAVDTEPLTVQLPFGGRSLASMTTPQEAEKADKLMRRDEASKSPIVTLILLFIVTFGIILVMVGWKISGIQRIVSIDQQALSQVEDLVSGLGVELFASALMILIIHHKLNSLKSKQGELFWVVAVIMAVAATMTCLSLCCTSPNFTTQVSMSLGIEFFGAVVVIVLLENVLDAMTGQLKGDFKMPALQNFIPSRFRNKRNQNSG